MDCFDGLLEGVAEPVVFGFFADNAEDTTRHVAHGKLAWARRGELGFERDDVFDEVVDVGELVRCDEPEEELRCCNGGGEGVADGLTFERTGEGGSAIIRRGRSGGVLYEEVHRVYLVEIGFEVLEPPLEARGVDFHKLGSHGEHSWSAGV